MPLLEDLASFVQLARTANFAKTAKQLGVTTSSLTRRIQALERELGYMLVQRSPRSVTLTEQGKQVYLRAQNLLQEAADLRSDLSHSSKQLAGPMRVGAPVDLAITVLGPPLAEFCREHPEISLNVVATQGQPDLQKDQLDLAFVIAHQRPLPDSAFTLSRIGAFRRLLFASTSFIEKHGIPESPKQLSDLPCVRHLQDQPEAYWDLRDGSKRNRVIVNGTYSTTSLANAGQAARAGLGIVMLPQHLAKPTSDGSLTQVLTDWEGAPAVLFAVTVRNHRLARISAMVDWVRAYVPARIAALDQVGVEI